MQIGTYRGAPFVDREEEIEFLVEWVKNVPQRVLWVYGPKSSGKTTVMEYVIEKRLLREEEWWEKGKYWVKYINLRRKLISNYKTFIHSFIAPDDIYKESVETDKKFSLKVFSIERKILKEIEEKVQDLFDVLLKEIERIKNRRIIPVIVIDEIQKLRDIYINGDRKLLNEFLNFCISVTKELHLSHVVILTSNTVFIERIYNDARMKKTSQFYKIQHLGKEKIEGWLIQDGLQKEDIDVIWNYFGGCIPDILKFLEHRKINGFSLKEYLDREAFGAYTEIVDFMARGKFKDEEIKKFKELAEEIVTNRYFELTKEKREYLGIIEAWAEKEILFYDPMELNVTGNSRIYEKGLEILLERW